MSLWPLGRQRKPKGTSRLEGDGSWRIKALDVEREFKILSKSTLRSLGDIVALVLH